MLSPENDASWPQLAKEAEKIYRQSEDLEHIASEKLGENHKLLELADKLAAVTFLAFIRIRGIAAEEPAWCTAAEHVMESMGHPTSPSLVIRYDNEIKVIYPEDENGIIRPLSLAADSQAEGPYVRGPFNPNLN